MPCQDIELLDQVLLVQMLQYRPARSPGFCSYYYFKTPVSGSSLMSALSQVPGTAVPAQTPCCLPASFGRTAQERIFHIIVIIGIEIRCRSIVSRAIIRGAVR